MRSSTTVITSKENMQEMIEKLTEMFRKEIGKGINSRINSIIEQSEVDKHGMPIIKVIVEFSDEITV